MSIALPTLCHNRNMSTTHDAVTAVLIHDGEVFLCRRQPQLPAFGGYYAFPGGKVDKTDSERPSGQSLLDAHPPRLINALVRELQEEIGFDAIAGCANGVVRSVDCLGEITTPAFVPIRFRTWFFKIVLNRRPALVVDAQEAMESFWGSPRELCSRYDRGQLLAAPPTLAALDALHQTPDCRQVDLARMRHDYEPETQVPSIEPLKALRILLVRSNTLPPAHHTNAFLFGDRHRVLVDPSPCDRDELEKLCRTLQPLGVHELFLTHHHPDHREHADELARRLHVPLGMSADTRQRIAAKSGDAFFDGLTVKLYREGDELTRWLDEPVRVIEVPGHDQGQLALMPDSRAWCIVGDLIQGIGTVVIAPPEGNMRVYFESMKKIIALDPAVVIPSHGGALGTTYRIREALKHREQREAQVFTLHTAGRTEDQMLDEIYQGTPPVLLPLARINIQSHLTKLREEGRV